MWKRIEEHRYLILILDIIVLDVALQLDVEVARESMLLLKLLECTHFLEKSSLLCILIADIVGECATRH